MASDPDATREALDSGAKRSVYEPNPAPASESNSDDLDSLLAEFEAGTSQSQAQNGEDDRESKLTNLELDLRRKDVSVRNNEAALQRHVELYTQHRQQEAHERDLKSAIEFIRGDDLDKSFFDDKLITAFLDKSAMENQALQEAWLNRGENPAKLQRMLTQFSKDLRRDYAKLPDRELTEDRNAVAAAVRGASVPEPAERPPNYMRMNNQEFREELKKLGIPSPI